MHINLVTSDICYKMLKVESRVRRRERQIDSVMKTKEETETQVNEQRMKLADQQAVNSDKVDQLQFRIQQKQSQMTKADEDNKHITKRIDLRKQEREGKDDMMEQLKKEIEAA